MGKKRKSKKKKSDVMTEEDYETYMMGIYNMSFIAGYTSGGVPYGISMDEEDLEPIETKTIETNPNDELPF